MAMEEDIAASLPTQQQQQQQQQHHHHHQQLHQQQPLNYQQASPIVGEKRWPGSIAEGNGDSTQQPASAASTNTAVAQESQNSTQTPTRKERKKKNQQVTIFQCKKCRVIISDTLSWCGAVDDEELKLFVVSKVVPDATKTSSQLTMSSSGLDRGSSYNELSCSNCGTILGRVYVTTTQHMDFARGMYTFHAEQMGFYVVGSQKAAEPGIDEAIHAILKPTPTATARQLAMIQTMIMSFHRQFEDLNQRVAQLEKK